MIQFSLMFWTVLVAASMILTGATIITLVGLFIVEIRKGTLW